jgi:hypothetical protein
MANNDQQDNIGCSATNTTERVMIAARALDLLFVVIWFPLVESSPFHYRPSAYDNSPAAAEGAFKKKLFLSSLAMG